MDYLSLLYPFHVPVKDVFEGYHVPFYWASLVAQMEKDLLEMWETQVWSLGWEDPLEEGIATHSSILAWRIPWTEEPGGLQSMGSQRLGHNWVTKHTYIFYSLECWSSENLCDLCPVFFYALTFLYFPSLLPKMIIFSRLKI